MIGIYYFINFKYVDTRWNRQSINTIDQYLTFVSLFVPAFSYAFSLSNAEWWWYGEKGEKRGKRAAKKCSISNEPIHHLYYHFEARLNLDNSERAHGTRYFLFLKYRVDLLALSTSGHKNSFAFEHFLRGDDNRNNGGIERVDHREEILG